MQDTNRGNEQHVSAISKWERSLSTAEKGGMVVTEDSSTL